MTNQLESAIARTPEEVWWSIFDYVLDASVLFSTIYQGDNWARDAHQWMLLKERDVYAHSENQRKIIGSVCKSWQIWAQSRRFRRIALDSQSKTWDLDVKHAQNARRVEIWANIGRMIAPEFPQGVEWPIVYFHQRLGAAFSAIPHPRLRRLHITGVGNRPYDPNPFLDVLNRFPDLTWLDYEDGDSARPGGSDVPVDSDRQPVVLQNLQALFYLSGDFFKFPLSHVVLPSLQYLAIHCDIHADLFPVVDVLLHYRQTIRSVTIGAYRAMHSWHTVQFPAWSEFPKLEELVMTQNWAFHFQPLPPDHPLKKLVAHHASLDAVPSMLDSINMQQIVLLRLHWTRVGTLERGTQMDPHSIRTILDVDHLVKKASLRGIRFAASESSDEGDELYLSREEFLAGQKAASKKVSGGRPKPGLLDRLARPFRSKNGSLWQKPTAPDWIG
ncbi:hypothetical protein CPB86DRAFT_873418 [Serendipita vermifera]|nr:hypothetical protein CPB86DRAFT_873418 [Serendipita vermifera]